MMLAELQQRLEQQFAALHQERSRAGYPVYVLEHGLDLAEIEGLSSLLSSSLREHRGLRRDYWLVWITIAAEIGYSFDGDEYWTTFAHRIPAWPEFGDRSIVRSWYTAFADRYGGLRPRGRWADHFSIIAWPIAHAILPRDLQVQFARHLYSLRHELGRAGPTAAIGELLQERKGHGSSRFDNLLEQTELTTRLVLALRDEDVQADVAAIFRPTLARIVGDLERHQNSRDWLHEARRVLRDTRTSTSSDLIRRGVGQSADGSVTRPRGVALIARQSAEGQWRLGVAFPNIAYILARAGMQPTELNNVSLSLADRPDSVMPGRALLTMSERERPIAKLAGILDRPLADLRPTRAAIAALMAQELRIAGSAPWVLRIQNDATARQVFGNHVRPGEDYIIVTVSPLEEHVVQILGMTRCPSDTDVTLYLLRLTDDLSVPELETLHRLKLGHVVRTRIEPVGLVPRWEGSDDSSVWLPDEEIILSLHADGPVDEFIVSIDGAGTTHVPCRAGDGTIISLGRLPLGRHVVDVQTVWSATSSRDRKIETERVPFHVRAPAPWSDGIRDRAGFRAFLQPEDASLRRLLEARARISIHGPAGRAAAIDIQTFDASGAPSRREELGRVTLPAKEHSVYQLLSKLNREPLSDQVAGAPRIDLGISMDELGRVPIKFEQQVQPLRWKLEKQADHSLALLVDEVGTDTVIAIHQYPISRPDIRIEVSRDDSLAGVRLDPPGALLTAKLYNKHYAAIVSVPGTIGSLAELAPRIELSVDPFTVNKVPRLTNLHRLWGRARTLGPLAPLRRDAVLRSLEVAICACVCGETFAQDYRQVSEGRLHLLDRLQRQVGGSPGFGYRMRQTDWRSQVQGMAQSVAFRKWANRYGISEDRPLAEFAFRLAFHPGAISFADVQTGTKNLRQLSENASLARGAFLAKLSMDILIAEVRTGAAA